MPAPRRPQEADAAKRIKDLEDGERRGANRPPKETPAELEECEQVFANF